VRWIPTAQSRSYHQLVKGLPARVTALPPRLQDAVVAVALTLINVGFLLPYRGLLHPQAIAFLLVVLETLPLIWRRTWPVAVFLVIGVARETYDRIPLGYAPLPLGPAIAYFTVMERCSTRVRVAISLLAVAGIIGSQSTPGHSEPYEFSIAVLAFAAAGMAGILSRTRRAYLAEVEARAARAESERDQEAALAAARERTSIARELHDVVAHHVSLMAVQAEAAASLLPGHPVQARSSVEIIGRTAREALTELRRLLGVLRGPAERPETAPSPSLDELNALLGVVRRAGLAVDLHVTGQPFHLAHGVDLTAYRIVQEALTNTLRHAPQASAAVTLSYEPGYLTVAVVDSGPGTLPAAGARPGTGTGSRPRRAGGADAASPAAAGAVRLADQGSAMVTADRPARQPRNPLGGPAPAGYGLAGIVERVASCGGSLTVGPTEAGGFAVTARLPVR
jgi:signal transduction histidine kinase